MALCFHRSEIEEATRYHGKLHKGLVKVYYSSEKVVGSNPS